MLGCEVSPSPGLSPGPSGNHCVTHPASAIPVLHLRHPTSCIQTRLKALHVLPIGTRGACTACGGVEGFLFLFLAMWRGFSPPGYRPPHRCGGPYELSSLGNLGFPQSISLCFRPSFYLRSRLALGSAASDGSPLERRVP